MRIRDRPERDKNLGDEAAIQEPGSVVENPVTLGFHLKGTDNMPHL